MFFLSLPNKDIEIQKIVRKSVRNNIFLVDTQKKPFYCIKIKNFAYSQIFNGLLNFFENLTF